MTPRYISSNKYYQLICHVYLYTWAMCIKRAGLNQTGEEMTELVNREECAKFTKEGNNIKTGLIWLLLKQNSVLRICTIPWITQRNIWKSNITDATTGGIDLLCPNNSLLENNSFRKDKKFFDQIVFYCSNGYRISTQPN